MTLPLKEARSTGSLVYAAGEANPSKRSTPRGVRRRPERNVEVRARGAPGMSSRPGSSVRQRKGRKGLATAALQGHLDVSTRSMSLCAADRDLVRGSYFFCVRGGASETLANADVHAVRHDRQDVWRIRVSVHDPAESRTKRETRKNVRLPVRLQLHPCDAVVHRQ